MIADLINRLTFPAESKPTIKILTSLSLPQKAREERAEYIRETEIPML
jgi:hypothetical protein